MFCQETKVFVSIKGKGNDKVKNYLYIFYHLALHKIFFFNGQKDKIIITENQLKEKLKWEIEVSSCVHANLN